MRSIGEDGKDQMKARKIMSEEEEEEEGKIDERFEQFLLKYIGHVACENDSSSEDEVQEITQVQVPETAVKNQKKPSEEKHNSMTERQEILRAVENSKATYEQQGKQTKNPIFF